MNVELVTKQGASMQNTKKPRPTAVSSYTNQSPNAFANAGSIARVYCLPRSAYFPIKNRARPTLEPRELQSPKSSQSKNSIRVLVSSMLIAVVFLVNSASRPAQADVTQAYFKTSCDETRGIARIDVKWADLGSYPEGFPYTADNIPGVPAENQAFSWNLKGSPPLAVCNLGVNRRIAIKGYNGPRPDGPVDIGIALYIGERFATSLPLAFFTSVIIKKEPKDFYVELSKCNDKRECKDQFLTTPSFKCDTASSPIEKGICVDNNLSALDADLYTAYQNRLSKVLPSTGDVFEGERSWLKQLSLRCLASHPDASWTAQPHLAPKQAECVEEQYSTRLKAIAYFNLPKAKP